MAEGVVEFRILVIGDMNYAIHGTERVCEIITRLVMCNLCGPAVEVPVVRVKASDIASFVRGTLYHRPAVPPEP